MSEWISVKESMPERQGEYLVYISHFKACNVDYWNGIYWVVDDDIYVYNSNDITHWMPLPEPPKEG